VFVEDTALLLDGHAVITRPGAASRAGEVDSTAAGLAAHFDVHRLSHGYLDGGDVLRIGTEALRRPVVAHRRGGHRRAQAGRRQVRLRRCAAELRGCLHLKTRRRWPGHDADGRMILLYNREAVDPRQFTGVEPIAVDPGEADAANVLWVGERVIMPAGTR
jgi:dimethylargininase